ncbi:hypothetical protein RIF29_38717 [Crotalaria pallida]|uniref:Uncharacterized protein n=1 Tax=Crotalaria pallida TaxID=3830 RepID=A0AAN9DZT7_CROPI
MSLCAEPGSPLSIYLPSLLDFSPYTTTPTSAAAVAFNDRDNYSYDSVAAIPRAFKDFVLLWTSPSSLFYGRRHTLEHEEDSFSEAQNHEPHVQTSKAKEERRLRQP